METFTIYPAIDLRGGKVVRLVQGDPTQQVVYGTDPPVTARRWLDAGASWLHVVNLDGAFEEPDFANWIATQQILIEAGRFGVGVQFGGGLRSRDDVVRVLAMGVRRVLLGTAAVQNLEMVAGLVQDFGADKISAALDAVDGIIRIRGWQASSQMSAVDLGNRLFGLGLRQVIYTDITRDGTGSGANIQACSELQNATSLQVIASGGVNTLEDISAARRGGLAGVIIGRALYRGVFTIQEALAC